MAVSAEARAAVRAAFGGRCGYCGVSETFVGDELEIDHFHPLERQTGQNRLERGGFETARAQGAQGQEDLVLILAPLAPLRLISRIFNLIGALGGGSDEARHGTV